MRKNSQLPFHPLNEILTLRSLENYAIFAKYESKKILVFLEKKKQLIDFH